VLAVPAELARDQPRVALDERAGFQPEPADRARRQVADEYVRPGDQRVERGPPVTGLQVERDRLLGPVEPDEPAGKSVTGRVVVVPGEVPAAGAFDLDDAGAEVGQVPGGERRGDGLL
jgi:hypothetical protein